MRTYDNKDWYFSIFKLHKSETFFRLWPALIIMGIYTVVICWLELYVFKVNKNSTIAHTSIIHSLLGFVISLLMAFRVNSAYDRWWEGRKLWGKLVNDSRNLAIKIDALISPEDLPTRAFFRKSIASYPHLLSRHLTKEQTRISLDESKLPKEWAEQETGFHEPAALVDLMTKKVMELQRNGSITDVNVLFVNNELQGFLDVCGGCERIKNTPIPFSYSLFIKKFIVSYCLILPIGYTTSIGYFTVPITIFVFYILMSLEIIAEEIEDPFNNDENDIPTELIAANIEKNVNNLIEK